MSVWTERLPAYAGFAAVLSAAGLPIYIYAPKYYADTFGVSLTLLGAVLFGLRLFDVVQDPFLGWVSERLQQGKALVVALAAGLMAVSMLGLFAVEPPIAPLWWFGLTVLGLVTAFSFLTICFYAQGVAKAGPSAEGHVRLAAWRESGALTGVCLAAIAPALLAGLGVAPYAAFAWGFTGAALLVTLLMWREWRPAASPEPAPMMKVLRDAGARRLMILALVNATPLAVTSTLFLFFVETRLEAPGWEGGLLVLFFLAAAVSAPGWAAAARRFGEKPVLLTAMGMAVLAFGFTLTLGAGEVLPFALICLASGASIGADLTLLPAMFARRLAVISPNGGAGFGLWSLVNKFTLAFAAVALLPLLEGAGFAGGGVPVPQTALVMLTGLYALLPMALKLVAIGLLAATRLED